MLVKLLEPLNVSKEVIDKLAQPIIDAGHEFVYYDTKTTDVEELKERSKDADVIMIANNPYPTDVIDSNNNLKYINVAFTGFDHVGLDEAKNKDNILMSNAAGYANNAVAELALGLTLDVYRQITQGDEDIRKADDFPGVFQGREIKGKTVAIVGLGKIGMMTAKLFDAFGANIIAVDAYENDEAKEMGIEYVSLEEAAERADIISLHTPLMESTRGLISKDILAKMKPTAILINTARGPVVDNEALAEALNNGDIAGAGLDVFDMEPPVPADYPLLSAKNAVLTPHVAFLTDESMEIRADIAFGNTIAFLEGNPQNVVNR